MKKFLKILGIVLIALFVLLLILPFAFKGKIMETIKTEANKNLNAKVDFSEIDLSLIRNFPNVSVGIDNLSIAGVGPFEGDTLAQMDELYLVADLMSVIKGDQIEIKKINLKSPKVRIEVREDGTANYDIAVENGKETTDDTLSESSMDLAIEAYSISDGDLRYHDASIPMTLRLKDLDHEGKGDFSKNIFTLSTETEVAEADATYDGTTYLRQVPLKLSADIGMNLDSMKFTFEENQLDLARLQLGFDGWLAMPTDDIDMDLSFALKKSDLGALMSLIPAEFAQSTKDVDAEGQVAFNGMVKGTYNDNMLPEFAISLSVADGRVQYPDLSGSIENIGIDAKVHSPQGSNTNNMTVEVPRFHAELGKSASNPNTVDATLKMRNPAEDPHIDTKVKADLNLGSLKEVLPFEDDMNLTGALKADFAVKGSANDMETGNFAAVDAKGSMELSVFSYSEGDTKVGIPQANATFSPEQLAININQLTYNDMNMSLKGYLDNYIAYAAGDAYLRGVFDFSADKIDANTLMGDQEEGEEVSTTDSTANSVVEIPADLDVTLNAQVDEIRYDNLELYNVKGKVKLQDQRAVLDNLTFASLGGDVSLSGSYSAKNAKQPSFDMAFDVKGIQIHDTYESFETLQKMAPIAKYAQGKLSSSFKLKTDLDTTMTPIYNSMAGRGTVSSKEVVLEGGTFLQKLSNTLKAPELARQEIKDLKATVVIADGLVETKPFTTKIGRIGATISGTTTFDETIDYTMALKVPSDALGSDFNMMATGLLAQANAFLGSNMSMGKFINMDVKITGDLHDPDIKPAFAGMEGSVKDQATQAVKEAVDEEIDKAKTQASEKAKEILDEAQKRADKVVADAEKAGQKLRDEANKQAQKLVDEAKNPLAKAGAKVAAEKVRKEADNQADNLVKEAQNQADNIMKKAREEADKIDE